MLTAEELLANNIDGLRDIINDDDLFFFYKGVICEYAKGFAELHVEESLKMAYFNHTINTYNGYDEPIIELDEESILTSYPLTNIK